MCFETYIHSSTNTRIESLVDPNLRGVSQLSIPGEASCGGQKTIWVEIG